MICGLFWVVLLKWPIERDKAVNLWANSSQDGEDDTRIIMDMNLRESVLDQRLGGSI